jgi:light-regulated signal transduction histidine kinase (bacteriophytochrome)
MGLHYPATDIPRVRSAGEFLGQLLSFQFAREEG